MQLRPTNITFIVEQLHLRYALRIRRDAAGCGQMARCWLAYRGTYHRRRAQRMARRTSRLQTAEHADSARCGHPDVRLRHRKHTHRCVADGKGADTRCGISVADGWSRCKQRLDARCGQGVRAPHIAVISHRYNYWRRSVRTLHRLSTASAVVQSKRYDNERRSLCPLSWYDGLGVDDHFPPFTCQRLRRPPAPFVDAAERKEQRGRGKAKY